MQISNDQKRAIIRRAMSNAKGDNLERANHAFGNLTPQQLNEMHGQSGKTRGEVWQDYKDERDAWKQANDYLEERLG